MLEDEIQLFFAKKPEALPLYAAFAGRVLAEVDQVTVKVQKSQISFYNRHQFACVSFLPVRKAQERPDVYIVVTLGLDHCVHAPRIDVATEPYPNRWTHHILIAQPEEIDDELMAWVKEAADFSNSKR